MTNTIDALEDIYLVLNGFDGTVFRVVDDGTVVDADNDAELLTLYRSAPAVPGSGHIHDDEHVSTKLGAGWSVVAHLHHEDTPMHYREQKIFDAAKTVSKAPGVYAVETFLDGDEYAVLSTYLLRHDA